MTMTSRRKEDTMRGSLLEATKELLWEVGYDEMSPRQVLERSGAGKGSLYHHFNTKLDLAAEALKEVSTEEVAKIDNLFLSDRPPLERIEAYLLTPRDPFKGCRLGRLVHESAIQYEGIREPIADYLRRVEIHIKRCLLEARGLGQLQSSADVSSIAASLVAVVQGAYVLARANSDEAEMQHALEGAVRLLGCYSHDMST
jgi:TetR/AcrR family transcriptional regulator, transcriptional repressor for nem operon